MELKELIESIDIVDFISQFVDLEEKNGEYWGLSPFQEEKTPSFSVRRETGKFYCFSSGIGGSAITFLQHYYGITSKEAIEKLKKYAGLEGESFEYKKKMSATITCKRFSRQKKHAKTTTATVLPNNYMERYEKREEKLAEWENEGISKESLDRFQVFYDSFSNRLVYPIRNFEGNIVNIGGRTLDPLWKEKKLRKYTYFHPWGALVDLYALYDNLKYIKEAGEIIIFEGCKSVLLADTWGIRNCAAALTSHLNPAQMKLLARLGCRVVFAFDKDVVIRNDHNIKKLKKYVQVEYLWDHQDLLDEKDSPVDKGREVFLELYSKRLRYR